MNPQTTATEVIEQEKQLVKELINLVSLDEITLNDAGWDSRVYSVSDGRYFFKFPRSDKIRERYKYEIAALKLAANISPKIKVPKVLWQHPNNNYFGYAGVLGAPLDEIMPTLDKTSRQDIGKTLGELLKQFHELKLPEARDITVEQEIEQFQKWYKPAVPVIQKTFSKTEQEKLEGLIYEVWPSELLRLGRNAALCHGDLHFPNIMRANGGQLGIIDFGDVGYYDRSKDFIDLNDNQIFESALQAYGDSKKLRQKITMRQNTTHIISLTYHIGKHDQKGIQKTLARIKTTL